MWDAITLVDCMDHMRQMVEQALLVYTGWHIMLVVYRDGGECVKGLCVYRRQWQWQSGTRVWSTRKKSIPVTRGGRAETSTSGQGNHLSPAAIGMSKLIDKAAHRVQFIWDVESFCAGKAPLCAEIQENIASTNDRLGLQT